MEDLADGSWRSDAPEGWPVQVVCHNDVAPRNTVFRGGSPVALIDWDTAAPGPRLWDVAYALWHFVPLYGDPDSDPFPPDAVGPRGERVQLFCDAYGIGGGDELVTAVLRRQRAVLRTYRSRAAAGDPAFTRLMELGADRGIQRQIAFVRRYAAALARG